MKRIYYLLFVLALGACKKNDKMPAETGCISEAKAIHFYLSPSDSATAFRLLEQNNLPANDLQVEYVQQDTITAAGGPVVDQYLFAVQYLNGFPILSTDFGYTFKNDVFTGLVGTRYTNINLDTRATQSMQQLRKLFLNESAKKVDAGTLAALKSACLVAQFGYYDLNARSVVPNHPTNFIMAWSVTPKGKQFPQVLLRDDSGGLIVYY